jgi:Ser/Thr protein kinase RdoA (MazF antagonist)
MLNSVHRNELANVAVGLWYSDNELLESISNSANYVYSFNESGKTRYLRLTSSCNRTKEQIEAEFNFIFYLHHGGVSVALPISSIAGQFVEEVASTNDLLFACVFEQVEGKRFRYETGESNKEHFRLCGRTLGQIHCLSKTYIPSSSFRRFAWDEDDLLIDVENFLPKSEKIVWQEYNALKERLLD